MAAINALGGGNISNLTQSNSCTNNTGQTNGTTINS